MEPTTQVHQQIRVLRRPFDGRLVAGVAAGLADYLDVDVVLVRVGLVVLAILGGLGVPLYLAAWLLIPELGSDQSLAEHLLGRTRDQSCAGWPIGTRPDHPRGGDDVAAS